MQSYEAMIYIVGASYAGIIRATVSAFTLTEINQRLNYYF